MPTTIYLDQNKWIRLLQQREGKISSPEIDQILRLVTTTAKNGNAIFPISQSHLIETATVGDPDRRERLFKFLLEISNGWTLAVFNIVGHEEVTSYFKQFNGENTNPQSYVLGRGLPFLIGGDNWYLSYTGEEPVETEITSEMSEKIGEVISEKGAFELGWKECIEILRDRDYEEDLVNNLEEIREQHQAKFSSNEKRQRATTINYYMEYIAPLLVYLCIDNGRNPHDLPVDFGSYLSDGDEAKDTVEFLQEFPANYVFTTLTFTRDIQKHRNIDENDLHDIMALSVAIPYCDVVVTENFWTHEAKRNNLDSLYDTRVVSDLSKLSDVISIQ